MGNANGGEEDREQEPPRSLHVGNDDDGDERSFNGSVHHKNSQWRWNDKEGPIQEGRPPGGTVFRRATIEDHAGGDSPHSSDESSEGSGDEKTLKKGQSKTLHTGMTRSMVDSAATGGSFKQFNQYSADDGIQENEMKKLLRATDRSGGGAKGTQVPRERMMDYLKERVKRDHDCFNIPFIILYFLSFDLVLLHHENVPENSQVQRLITNVMEGSGYAGYEPYEVSGHKFMDDVGDTGELYQYLNEAIIPAFINPLTDTPRADKDRVHRYNQLLGGLQLMQTRRARKNCADTYPNLGPFNEMKRNPFLDKIFCYPPDSRDTACFGLGGEKKIAGYCPDVDEVVAEPRRRLFDRAGRRLFDLAGAWGVDILPSVTPYLSFDSGEPIYSLVMDSWQGQEKALNVLNRLWAESDPWVDEQTAWVGIKFLILNPDLGIFTSVQADFFFAASGAIIPDTNVLTFVAEPYQNSTVMYFDGLWLLLYLELVFGCFKDLAWAMKKRAQRMATYSSSLWTYVDWLSVVMGGICILLWWFYLDKLSIFKLAAMEVAIKRPVVGDDGTPPTADVLKIYDEAVTALNEATGSFEEYLGGLRFFLAIYNLILMTRFFKAFEAQPQLAIIKKSVMECMPDLFHFGIVFLTLLISFAAAGVYLFGHRLAEFSTPGLAMERCLLILFGVVDYDKLTGEHPGTSLFWLVVFITLLNLVMLNMCLAIIMDVYGGQKAAAAASESIFEQLWGLRQKRVEVPAQKILNAVEQLEKELINKDILMEALPEMRLSQARQIIEIMERVEVNTDNQGLTMTDATKLVSAIKRSVTKIAKQVDAVTKSQDSTKKKMENLMDRLARGIGAPVHVLHPNADNRLRKVEHRLTTLEELLNESMNYSVYKGKLLRDRFQGIEEQLRNNRRNR